MPQGPTKSASGSTTNYITPRGYRMLADELDRLWKVDRPKITQEVADAAAHGDRSENAEYIYGKKKLREIDRRIRFLGKRIDELQVVQPSAAQQGRVFFGARVTVENEDGEELCFQIVGPDEYDLKQDRISVDSPMGKALLGKAEGDEVRVQRPKGVTTVTIVDIDYELEV
jgi:transcription elongation factor GreB